MTEVIDIGDRRELFVDNLLIDRMERTSLRLHEPVSGGVAIEIDRPWEGPANGRYLLYYRGMTPAEDQLSGVLCVATSDDGVTWTKPALGLVECDGHGTRTSSPTDHNPLMIVPWQDTRPGVPDDERIKALYSEPLSGEKHTAFQDPGGPKRLMLWASAGLCSPRGGR
ncbi:MAG TPA: hypothetical protein DIC52_21910 [Candidatus Latescibacteria bacterium]|nr:hypothetical protein [Candidatus Latescibacterota bacterium]